MQKMVIRKTFPHALESPWVLRCRYGKCWRKGGSSVLVDSAPSWSDAFIAARNHAYRAHGVVI